MRLATCTFAGWTSLLLAPGCSDEALNPVGAPAGRVEVLAAGAYSVRVDTGPREIALLRGDDVLLRFPADGLRLGTMPAVDDETNYDPYRLLVPHILYVPLDGLVWSGTTAMEVASVTETTIELVLGHGPGLSSRLTIDAEQEGSFRARFVPDAGVERVAFLQLRPRADPAEGFYGLGESFDAVDQRGKIRAMQIEADATLESQYNEAHVPVPLLTGTRGWGLFVASRHPGSFAVATGADDLVEAAFGTGTASKDGLAFHLFAQEHPLDLTRLYYDVTGYPRLPARWALGPWVWRDENVDQAEVEADLDAIRTLDLATTAVWIDRPYATAVNTFDFDAPRFPNPAAMYAKMTDLGFRTALWHTPYLDEKDQAADTAELRAVADAGGYYPTDVGLPLNGWGKPIDLTNPDARAWWQNNLAAYVDLGVSGFKLDYGEDVVLGIAAVREPWVFDDGSDERTMKNGFQLAYHSTYAELFPEPESSFLLCRGGTWGDQANVDVIWPGDLDALFAKNGETVDVGGETITVVGGLPASIIAGLSLGPSGFPFFGADTGGYRHSPPDKELFTRWFEQTALSTVMQIGTSSNDVAWQLGGDNGFDQEMLDWYRIYTRLKLRLFPYTWTYAKKLAEDGRPIQRALGLAHPELGVHPDDTYLYGDVLLVAPVVERGKTSRDVVFPEGRWVHWWSGEAIEGAGVAETVDAPLHELPLFLAEGAIVPMLRPTIDTLSATTADADLVDSYATTAGVLWVRVVPGAASAFRVFDGTQLDAAGDATSIALSTNGAGAEFTSGVVFEAIAIGGVPASVESDGAALAEVADLAALQVAAEGWTWADETGGTVWVKVGPGSHDVAVAR